MLRKVIKYTDFNDSTHEDTYYFHLTKSELIELDARDDVSGLGEFIEKMVDEKNNKAIVQEYKNLILAAYGKKSDDGKKFEKSDKLREEFASSAAFDALFFELCTDADAASAFITGIVPQDVRAEVNSAKSKKTGNTGSNPRTAK